MLEANKTWFPLTFAKTVAVLFAEIMSLFSYWNHIGKRDKVIDLVFFLARNTFNHKKLMRSNKSVQQIRR